MKDVTTDRRLRPYKMLPVEQLNRLSTQRLLNILKTVRGIKGRIYHDYVCECCDEFVWGEKEDYLKEVKPYADYFDTIKSILSTREHIA